MGVGVISLSDFFVHIFECLLVLATVVTTGDTTVSDSFCFKKLSQVKATQPVVMSAVQESREVLRVAVCRCVCLISGRGPARRVKALAS